MMVIFTSKSEKKSIHTVRRILDSFANRIGDDTWQTQITNAGLEAVYTALKRNATKNTSVSCRWIRGRNRSELLWVVGNRLLFNSEGYVAVNHTKKDFQHKAWENDWQYMPLLKAYTALAALFHDWGKASDLFQDKLRNKSLVADPYRHEFISCKMLEILVAYLGSHDSETAWLDNLANGIFSEADFINAMDNLAGARTMPLCSKSLPVHVKLLQWLILSHHRIPLLQGERAQSYSDTAKNTVEEMLAAIDSSWGYENSYREDFADSSKQCFTYSKGILWDASNKWRKQVCKWAKRLSNAIKAFQASWPDDNSMRCVLYYSRLSLMLADHYVSSLSAEPNHEQELLWANTDKHGFKQTLSEHLIKVTEQSLKILHQLPLLTTNMERAEDVRSLRAKSLGRFAWQDKAATEIRRVLQADDRNKAFFVVNMASTGCGKTIANAKIVKSMSGEASLRYILALGLRSLTLQTGDEYKNRIGLKERELAVLIGSKAIQDLHQEANSEESYSELYGEGARSLVEESLEYLDDIAPEQTKYMDIFFANNARSNGKKNRAFLLKPVLVATIDHIMGATENLRGGHHILPGMRLMSSDLVIDEIDDFGPTDLVAIARLVHLAGMMGRNVVISSATIPPDLAEGLYHTYMNGLSCYNAFFITGKHSVAVWCDEFNTAAKEIANKDVGLFASAQTRFAAKRVQQLGKKIAARKGYIASISTNGIGLAETYAELQQVLCREIRTLHEHNHIIDKKTGKRISFGLIRVANINPCVLISRMLMQYGISDDIQPFIMAYHSRQILLLRHEQEKYLDGILKRHGEPMDEVEIQDHVLREHIDASTGLNVTFIVVSTPVEEVGRDHDFDWAIVEPSSYRSIIQLAGRIRRHRPAFEEYPFDNIAILQYNLRALRGEDLAYRYPGFETCEEYRLDSHDMTILAGGYVGQKKIDAIPRVIKPNTLQPHRDLVHLEHKVMADFNDWQKLGPCGMHGWDMEYWWLTGIPQLMNRFRNGPPQKLLYCRYLDGKVSFCERINGEMVPRDKLLDITATAVIDVKTCWLHRDYVELLEKYVEKEEGVDIEEAMTKLSVKYGEISISDESNTGWRYNDQLGMIKEKKEEVELWGF